MNMTQDPTNSPVTGRTNRWREQVEYLILFSTAGVSLIIAILDLTGLLDASSWVAQRLPSLTLLCVGFVASYLIIERRGKLDYIASLVEQRTDAILKAIGVEVQTFETSAELVSAFAARICMARRVDDVTWMEGDGERERWSGQDLAAYRGLTAAIDEVSRNPDVVWREVRMFLSRSQFESEKNRMLDPRALTYNVAYYDPPSSTAPPRFGLAVVDRGAEGAEVFLASAHRRLRIRHPAVADFFSQYFELVWNQAKKIKRGTEVSHELLDELEANLTSPTSTSTPLPSDPE